MNMKRYFNKKILAMLLSLSMVLNMAPLSALAVTTDTCTHHLEHTADCGYAEAVAGQDCTHKHSEDCYAILECLHTCTEDCDDPCTHQCTVNNGCITMDLDCHHVHDDCGYSEGTAEVPCGHVHNESCGYAEAVAGTPCINAETDPECDHLGSCGYVAAVEGHPCGHTEHTDCGYAPATEGTPCTHTHAVKVDSADSCYKLLCSHRDGGHDDACGYVAAAPAHECHYECAECAAALTADETTTPSTEATTEPSTEETEPAPACDCGTDDAAIHATTCAVYVAPEMAVCYCTEKCSDINIWCDICGFDYTACIGTDSAAAYADGITVEITGADGGTISVTLQDADSNGYYDIGTADELYAFAAAVNGGNGSINGELTANIVVNKNVLNANGELNGTGEGFRVWTPIGTVSYPYGGTFDGKGHWVSGLYFSDPDASNVGLFGRVLSGTIGDEEYNGTVQNVGVVDSYLSGKNNIGGVVGRNEYSTIQNCYNAAAVSGNPSVGGVAGGNYGTITECHNTGAVTGTGYYVGGVVGNNSSSGTITECHNTGTVDGTNYVGGVAGNNGEGTIAGCYNEAAVNGTESVGGVVGNNNGGTITECHNTGTVTGTEYYVGGVVGNNRGKITDCYNTGTVDGTVAVGGVAGNNNEGTIAGCYNEGAVTGTEYYVGGVVGENNGGTITGCNNTAAVSGTDQVGGVVGGNSEGTVTNCYNSGTVDGSWYVGGVVGENSEGTVTNCYNSGAVNCTRHQFGGVVGNNNGGTITNCYYLDTAAAGGIEEEDVTGQAEAKTAEQFASGEVAHLLGEAFGQNIDGEEKQTYPVLSDARVYYGYPNCNENASPIYTNDALATELPGHGGGTATCTKLAVCQKCGTSYGEVDKANHTGILGAPVLTDDGTKHVATWSCCSGTVTEDHTYVYTLNETGNTITVSCSANCGYEETATISATGKTYDGTAVTANVSYSNWTGGDLDITYAVKDGETLTEAPKDAGTYTASITFSGVTASVEFTIEKANAEAPTGLTAYYGQTLANVTLADGWSWVDATVSVGEVGNQTHKANYAGSQNYKAADNVDVTVTVSQSGAVMTATADKSEYTYGETVTITVSGITPTGAAPAVNMFALTAPIGNQVAIWNGETQITEPQVVTGDALTFTVTGLNAGGYTLTAKFTGNTNMAAAAANVTFVINNATLTVTADDKTMCVGNALPELTYTITGFVSGDSEDMLTTKPTISCEADGTTAGTYAITVSGAMAENYSISYVQGQLSVNSHSTAAVGDKAATCTAKAYCSVCESEYGEFDKTNHDETVKFDENGFCDNCDAYEPAVLVGDYYEIENAGQLFWFAEQVNGGAIENTSCAVLTADIDLKGIAWTPITNFSGTFDGAGYEIKNFAMDITDKGDHGLFGFVKDATIKNFTIYGEVTSTLTAKPDDFKYGVIADAAGNTMIADVHSYVNLTINDNYFRNFVGGILGRSNDAGANFAIERCSFGGTLNLGDAQVDCTGGIVAYVFAGNTVKLNNCLFNGNIISKYNSAMQIGGMIGYYRGSGLAITNSLSVGDIAVNSNTYMGAIVGILREHSSANEMVKNNYYREGDQPFGNSNNTTKDDITDGYGSQTVAGSATAATEALLKSGEVAYKLGSAWGQTCGTGLPTLGGPKVYKITGSPCPGSFAYVNDENAQIEVPHDYTENGFCKNCDDYEPAALNSDGYYEIGNAGQLYWFAQQVNGGNTAINGELTADIVVNENVLDANGDLNDNGSNFRVWTPIGRSGSSSRYIGNFDGGNHTVSGLYFNDSSATNVGLFGVTYDGATIKNVGVVDSWFFARMYVGGIAGQVINTTILNCYNTGTVHSTERQSGGIVGYVYRSCTVSNCYNAGKIGSNEEVGGVVGMQAYSNSIVNNCYNIGTVSGSNIVGGIVGYNQGPVTNCYNIGTVVGNTNVGALMGKNIAAGNVTSCYYLAGNAGIGSDTASNKSVISEITEAQVKAASGEDGALVDMLNAWVAQQNDAKYKGWHLCASISSEYPSLNYECTYSDSGKNHIAKCTLCGSETAKAHTYFYTANDGAINENCELCDHSASIKLVLPEAPVYNENEHVASYAGDYTNPNVTVSIQYLQSNEDSETGYDVLESAPVDAGTYIVRLSVGEVYIEQSMTIAPKEITLIGAEVESKDYDGTPFVQIDPTYGHGGFKTEGVSIYDSIKILCTSAELESANAGSYDMVTVKGLTIEGDKAHNYTVVSEATIPVYNIWGNRESSVTVWVKSVVIDLLDQEAGSPDDIDQNKWEIGEYSGLLEGHRIDSIKLVAEMNSGSVKYGSISVEEGSLKIVDAEGNDVTANYSVTAYAATLTITCPDHDEFEDGFCKNCDGFEKPNYNENEDYYEIANAGQLFWFAEYIANVTNEANAKLTADITIPEGKEWTPIYNLYGTFDGNFKTISGLHVSESDNQYVGFLGYIGYWANVRNLHITNSSFVDADATYVGAIVGYHGGGEITNCYTDETVKIETNGVYGALVGGTSYSTMKNCYAHGALVGNGRNGTFENCYYIGEDDGIDGTTAVTAEQLKSGEVAYRLQSGIVGEDIWDDETGEWIGTTDPELIWGQTIGTENYPVLKGKKVYFDENADPQYYNEKSETISVDITWGAMSFTYTDGEWNPETHTYGEGKWTADNDSNWITVKNNGTVDAKVTFAYDEATGMDAVNGSFTTDGTNRITEVALAVGKEEEIYLLLTGKPNETNGYVTLGTITVTITTGGE